MKERCLRNKLLRNSILGIAVTGCTVTMPAIARVEYSYAVEAERTDNVRLTAQNEQSERELSGLLALSVVENNPGLSANISSVADYTNYQNDTFSDDVWYYLNSDINWVIRPSSFIWVIQDYFTQQELDTALPTTPDNVIDTNVFSTGPDLFFRLSPGNRLGVGARLIDYRFENTTTDSRRKSINVNWLYGLDSSTDLSLNVEHQTADFSQDATLNFNREDIYFRMHNQYSRSHFEIDLGVSLIDRDAYEDVDGYLTRLVWRNQFRSNSHFQLNASSQYTDTGQDLLNAGAADRQLNRVGEQVSGDIFRDQRIEATYRLGFSASGLEMQGLYRDENYEISQQDRITRGFQLVYDYIYSSQLNLNASSQFNEYESLNIDQTNEELNLRLMINYRLTRNYTIRTEFSRITQQSNIPENEYTENRVLFSFYYGRHPESYR